MASSFWRSITPPSPLNPITGILGVSVLSEGTAGQLILNDCATLAQANVSNELIVIPYQQIPSYLDLPVQNGLVISQVPTEVQIIPLPVPERTEDDSKGPRAIYEFETDEETILLRLLPQNLAIQVYRAMLESNAGFYGAQMTSMDNATRNAGDMINRLTQNYNRTRQANITRELIEIISGAEAL